MFSLQSILFSQDPKLEFKRSATHGVNLLAGPPIDPQDPYWAQYWLLFSSPVELLTLLSSELLQQAALSSPENLATLVEVITNHLFTLISLPSFPRPFFAPLASPSRRIRGLLPGISTGDDEVDLRRETLNCIRVLSRVIPFIVKSPQPFSAEQEPDLEERLFWRSHARKVERSAAPDAQFVIDSDDEDAADARAGAEEFETIPPLAQRLFATLVDLCFVPGFTLVDQLRRDDNVVSYVIWESGIAAPPTLLPPSSPAILSARLEIVRLLNLLVALPTLVTSPLDFPVVKNRWRDAFLLGPADGGVLDRKVVLCLLCSLLNTGLATTTFTSLLSPSLPGSPMSGAFDFGSLKSRVGEVINTATSVAVGAGREDVKELLVGSCLQLLGVALVEHSLPSPTAPEATNTFCFYLAKLHRPADLAFLLSGILAVLSSALSGPGLPSLASLPSFNPLPGAPRKTHCLEALILLTRVLEINPRFFKYVLETAEKGGQLCRYLLGTMLHFKDDVAQFPLLRIISFLLQTITAERAMGARINESSVGEGREEESFRTRFGVPGTMGDFLIVSVHTLIFTTRARLSSLYPSLILALTNLSPYLKQLSIVSSNKFLAIFLAFSNPGFLLMEEGNPRLVFYLLEALENVLRWQLSDNPNLVYALIRSSPRFEELSTFTLAGGVEQIRKARRVRKSPLSSSVTGSSLFRSASSASLSSLIRITSPGNSVPGTPMPLSPRRSEGQGFPFMLPDRDEKLDTKGEEMEMGAMSPTPKTEKQLGKMRAQSDAGDSDEDEEDSDDETFAGKNGFVPTESWVASWREHLPLDIILVAISEFRPRILALSTARTASAPDAAIVFLRTATLLGLLPPAPPLKPRRFKNTLQFNTWLGSTINGQVYLASLELLREVEVKLFSVQGREREKSALELVGTAASFVVGKIAGAGPN